MQFRKKSINGRGKAAESRNFLREDRKRNVKGSLNQFRIFNDRYSNKRKRFALRFNLIRGIYNFEIGKKMETLEKNKGLIPYY